MNLGVALVICTVLVLAVFRPDFRKFLFWVIAIGAGICVTGLGVWWARTTYQIHTKQAADTKHHLAAIACVKRLTGIDPNTTPDTLPANWFVTIAACEKDPETAQAVPDYQKIACETGALDPECSGRQHSSVIEIHGGETLRVVQNPNPPKSQTKDGLQLDMSSSIPLVYLGHNQQFVFACGVFGEQPVPKEIPSIKKSTATCP